MKLKMLTEAELVNVHPFLAEFDPADGDMDMKVAKVTAKAQLAASQEEVDKELARIEAEHKAELAKKDAEIERLKHSALKAVTAADSLLDSMGLSAENFPKSAWDAWEEASNLIAGERL